MRVLLIANQKGGVGKTTTAVTLAHGLALLGKRVLLVDLDAQGNVADALGLNKRPDIYRLLVDGDSNVILHSGRPGLGVVLGNKRTYEAREVLSGRLLRELAVREALERIANGWDIAVLDTAPGADLLQIGALIAADWFLVPVSLEHLAVVGVVELLATAASLGRAGVGGAQFLGVLPTMWERTTNESHAQLEEIVREFSEWVWPPIPLDVNCREAVAHGKTLWEWAGHCRALDGIAIRGERVGGYRAALKRLISLITI